MDSKAALSIHSMDSTSQVQEFCLLVLLPAGCFVSPLGHRSSYRYSSRGVISVQLFFLCECSTFSFGFVGQSLPHLIRRIGITVRDVPVSTDSRHGLFIACLQINSQQHLLHNFERAAEQMNETVSPKIYQHIDASCLN